MIRSRKAMIAYIRENTTVYCNHAVRPFCFNIKMRRNVDLSFDNLLRLSEQTFTDEERDKLKLAYDNLGDDLYDHAIESALASYSEPDFVLINGKTVQALINVYGRSGGWLSIDGMNGHNFEDMYSSDITEMFNGDDPMPFTEVRNLYWLVETLKEGVDNRYTEVAHHASSILLSWE